MRRGYTRRGFLAAAARAGAAGAAVSTLPLGAVVPKRAAAADPILSEARRRTLDAALARMIPADGPGDWTAADLGAGDYIEGLLSGSDDIYAGGPTRDEFDAFPPLSRVKEMGWANESRRLRGVYEQGLDELDRRAGGSFADAPEPIQDLVLTTLDLEGSEFFAALYEHTMEGVYAHPVYRGNTGYRAWEDLCYQGDVHGVRYPTEGSVGAWNTFGGYAPEEMIEPGACPGQGPVT
ncbi:MAG: gluconate 2-dehydrogenase subunit 3 family protein [Actinomycetota bacterium]